MPNRLVNDDVQIRVAQRPGGRRTELAREARAVSRTTLRVGAAETTRT
jgi:hypothetical protein